MKGRSGCCEIAIPRRTEEVNWVELKSSLPLRGSCIGPLAGLARYRGERLDGVGEGGLREL